MGFYGRLAASPSEEFLSKAEIRSEDLSQARAGADLEPALPKLRRELGASARDEDLLLAAFYDRSLLAPLKAAHAPCRFSTTPLMELMHYLESRKDVRQAKVKFSGTEITLVA
jgi:oxaloacetate decarboxylase alpha subunit